MKPLSRWQVLLLMATPLLGIAGLIAAVYGYTTSLGWWGEVLFIGGTGFMLGSVAVAVIVLIVGWAGSRSAGDPSGRS